MVEILTNYSSQVDAKVVGLVEVEGHTNVFKRCRNSDSTFTIPSTHLFRFSHNVPASRFPSDEMDDEDETWFELDPMAVPDIIGCNTDNQCPPDTESLALKWSAKRFAPKQVWAVYESLDSMARQYVIVNNVISEKEVSVTILDPYPTIDDEIYWIKQNLPLF